MGANSSAAGGKERKDRENFRATFIRWSGTVHQSDLHVEYLLIDIGNLQLDIGSCVPVG